MFRHPSKLGNFEALEAKKLMTADLAGGMPIDTAQPAEVRFVETDVAENAAAGGEIDFVEVGGGGVHGKPMCYLKYKLDRAFVKSWSKSGDAVAPPSGAIYVNIPMSDKTDLLAAFSFGVEREMKESGEKGGTQDINIGIGELQECTISKSGDSTSMDLAQFAIRSNSCGVAEIEFVEFAGEEGAEPATYLTFELPRAFVKSRSISGDADDRPTEEVAFYYNKIGFAYVSTADGKTFESSHTMAWDNVENIPWTTRNDELISQVDSAMEAWGRGNADDRPTEEVAFYYNDIT